MQSNASSHEIYPDQSQREACRELGYHLGWQWLEANAQDQFWQPPSPSSPPASLAHSEQAAGASLTG